MKRLFLVFSLLLALLPLEAFAADGYGYPPRNAYQATILGTPEDMKLPAPERFPLRRLVLDVIPGLQKPDVFFYDEGLRCTLAAQKGKAPLVFVIAGTGAGDQSQKALAMAKGLYKAGYHVITVPSPTHPNFIVSASRSHVPGELGADAADLYRVMEAAWDKVREDVDVSDFHLTGYSLGGTHAAFVARLDEERRTFNFRRVLLVNPAVNLFSSISQIEELLNRVPGGPKRIGAYLNRMMARLTDYYRSGAFTEINNEFLYSAFESGIFSDDESGALIGVSFRLSLAGLIFASDVMTNGGYVVPKNRILTGTDKLGDYFLVSFHLSFFNFFDEFFFPHMAKNWAGLTREEAIRSLGLQNIEGYLKTATKIGLITNEDDFILTGDDLGYLRGLFGSRAMIYPRGGHLGNLEYRDNMQWFTGFFGGAR